MGIKRTTHPNLNKNKTSNCSKVLTWKSTRQHEENNGGKCSLNQSLFFVTFSLTPKRKKEPTTERTGGATYAKSMSQKGA